MSNWRTSSGVLAFVSILSFSEKYDEKKVLLTNVDNSKDKIGVKKLAEKLGVRCFKEVWIDNPDKFSMKFGDGLSILVKHPNLPEPDQWYTVENFLCECNTLYFPTIYNLITQADSDKGIFTNNFETIFCEDYPLSVSFVNSEMDNYSECVEEMERRLNVDLYKKTTKWELGHRYDNLKDSLYSLGVWKSRITNRFSSKETWDFSDSPTCANVYGFLSSKPKGDTADDFWKDIKFSNYSSKDTMYLATKKTSGVDVGLFMDASIDIFKNWRETVFENTLENICKEEIKVVEGIPNQLSFNKIHLLLEPFLYVIPEDEGKSMREIAAPFLDTFTEIVLVEFKNIYLYSKAVTDSSVDLDMRAEELVRLFISTKFNAADFHNKHKIISEFFEKIDLKLFDIAKEFLIDNSSDPITGKDIENYIINQRYITQQLGGKKFFDMRKKSLQPTSRKPAQDLSSIIPENIKEEIYEMITEALNNYGLGIETLQYQSAPNKLIEGCYVAEVTVSDIWMKYYKKGQKIPSNLTNDIISSKFWSLTLSFDETWKPE